MNQPISRRTALTLGAVAAGGLLLSKQARAEEPTRRVVVWSEGTAPKKVYPNDIRGAIAEGLKPLEARGWKIVTATITDPDQGVPEDSLNSTDVLIWWGHQLHGKVKDENVARIVSRVKEGGMGFIALHSSHFAKPLKKLLGTPCSWKAYVEDGSPLKVIVKDKEHPIARDVADFELPHTERYTEPFAVPEPESLVLDGIYVRKDGVDEPARQGLVWTIGRGKVFYFQPGHETYPIFFDENVRKIMLNAVEWMAPKA
jgi:trehalose utilization protein